MRSRDRTDPLKIVPPAKKTGIHNSGTLREKKPLTSRPIPVTPVPGILQRSRPPFLFCNSYWLLLFLVSLCSTVFLPVPCAPAANILHHGEAPGDETLVPLKRSNPVHLAEADPEVRKERSKESIACSQRTGDPGWVEKIPLTGCRKITDTVKGCEESFSMKAEKIDVKGLEERMGPNGQIPLPGKEQLTYKTGKVFKKDVHTVDLSAEVHGWLALDFQDPAYGADEQWVKSVGNMLEAFQKVRGNAAEQEELLKRLETAYPRVWEEVKTFLPEWVRDDYLYSDDWNPGKAGKPEKAENDGILERPPFLLKEESGTDTEKGRKIYQACAPIYATLPEIMAVEQDFQAYYKQAGSNYLEVFPLPESFFSGKDEKGLPFLLYDVSYHQKPFPLWNLKFVLRQAFLNKNGRWQMVNRLVEGDMNHLRLRIFYNPILNTKGKIVGYVKTEWLDLDVKGLPEGDSDRIAGVRGDVGNIKKMADQGTP